MRGLAAERVAIGRFAIEAHAERGEFFDRVRRVRRETRGDMRLHEPSARGDRVGRMQRGRIVVADGRRDAALRPGRRRHLTEFAIRHERRAQRSQIERREHTRKAAADDDRVEGARVRRGHARRD